MGTPPETGTEWTEVLGALTSAATLVVVVVGAFFAKRQLDATASSRHATLLAELSRRWDELLPQRQKSAEYTEPGDLANAIQEFYEGNARDYYDLARIPNFFEDLAVQVTEQTIPIEMVRKLFGDAITYQWSRWKVATRFLRHDQPFVYEEFEKLAEQLTATNPP